MAFYLYDERPQAKQGLDPAAPARAIQQPTIKALTPKSQITHGSKLGTTEKRTQPHRQDRDRRRIIRVNNTKNPREPNRVTTSQSIPSKKINKYKSETKSTLTRKPGNKQMAAIERIS